VDGGYRHGRYDYSIGVPGAGWERVDVDDATLSFQRGGADTLSMVSRCGRPVAKAQLMARHLVIGLEDRTLVTAGPVSVAGYGGWTQTFDSAHSGYPVRIKTVTLVLNDCSFDWILVAAGPFEPAEVVLDAWWASFRLGDRYVGATEP